MICSSDSVKAGGSTIITAALLGAASRFLANLR
jgi:hypothetical protein